MKTDSDIIKDIYWLIGRADSTDSDLKGSVKQISWYIEEIRPELAKKVAEEQGWRQPLFEKK